MRIANRDARRFVNDCISFRGNNLYGEILRVGLYVVYSFGNHFPLYAKIKGKWYRNKEKYSRTTSKHVTQACPCGVKRITGVSLEKLQDLIAERLREK